MQKSKYYRYFLSCVIIAAMVMLSNVMVQKFHIGSFSMFETTNLFTYFGVLIGFAITIYTFGLSMVTSIKDSVEKITEYTTEEKNKIYESLVSGFCEIKEDIWLIFYAILFIVFFTVAKNIENPFGWEVEKYRIPETANVSLFFISTFCMYDIMKTLFNLSEINLELINKKKA